MKEKIGLVVPPIGYDKKTMMRIMQMADEMGFHSIWVAEAWGMEAFTTLTELACRTKKIQIGTCIVNIFSRTAGLMAMTAATLDEISGGRFILGLGTSGQRVIENFHGVPFKKPLTRLKEYVDIINILIRGGRLNEHQGELFKLDKFKLTFTPSRKHIPIYIASLTPKSIEQTGEIADGWIPTYYPLSKFRDILPVLESGVKKVQGKKLSDVAVAPMLTLFAGDPKEAEFKCRSLLTFYICNMGKFYYEMLTRVGYGKEADAVKKLGDEKKQFDAMQAIPKEMLEDITVYGEPAECREKLQKWMDAGVTNPILPLDPSMTEDAAKKLFEALS